MYAKLLWFFLHDLYRSSDIEENGEDRIQQVKGTNSSASLASEHSAVNKVYRAMELESFGKTMKIYCGVLSIGLSSSEKILHRQKLTQQRWNKMLLVLCVIVFSLDPLFCYILVVNDEKKCLGLDRTLGAIAIVLRSVVDIFYVLYIIYRFRASVATLSSQSSRKGRARARRYLLLYFLSDILVILPLPQVVVFTLIPRMNSSRAAFNLFLYMLASHVVGAFWYLFSIERKASCWLKACKSHATAYCSLYCGAGTLDDSCSSKTPNSTLFNFGIYKGALESGVVRSSTDFMTKISYCFWWGLKNLRFLWVKTSKQVPMCGKSASPSVFVSLSGLILLAFLIGNMQTYLQSKTARQEKMRLKGQDIDLWMASHSLPRELKKQINRYQDYKWQVIRSVDVESLLHNLPRDIRRETKQHLCSNSLNKVPMLQNMDKRLLDAIYDHLKLVLYINRNFIFRKGDPLDEMLFITRGELLTYTTTDNECDDCLKKGNFYGQELLDWALRTCTNPGVSNLPFSTKTVQAHTDVEVFALRANDLKNVVSKFWWLFPSSSLEQARKPRAAQALQAAWGRHKYRQRLAGLTV
ncbi:hypothetical protein ABKV19_024789 [Rosa sericea]